MGESIDARLPDVSSSRLANTLGGAACPGGRGCKLPARVWARRGAVDHNHTKLICNIADTALHPVLAAQQTAALLKTVTG